MIFVFQPVAAPRKHVSNITVGKEVKKDHVSASAFDDDDRHFDVSITKDENEIVAEQNGAKEDEIEELDTKFGKATLSRSAPVSEKVVSTHTDDISL